MSQLFVFLLSIQLGLVSTSAFAETSIDSDSTGRMLEHLASKKCRVYQSAGKRPYYKVFIEGHPNFEPRTNGISGVHFSSTGKYLALTGGAPQLIDITQGHWEYGLVIINCENGKVRGYRKKTPTESTGWSDGSALKIVTSLDLKDRLP